MLEERNAALELQNKKLAEDLKGADIIKALYQQAAGELAALKKTMRLHGSVDVRQWTVSPAADLSWRRAASTAQLQAAIQDFERQIAAIQSVIRLCLCQRWCQSYACHAPATCTHGYMFGHR